MGTLEDGQTRPSRPSGDGIIVEKARSGKGVYSFTRGDAPRPQQTRQDPLTASLPTPKLPPGLTNMAKEMVIIHHCKLEIIAIAVADDC